MWREMLQAYSRDVWGAPDHQIQPRGRRHSSAPTCTSCCSEWSSVSVEATQSTATSSLGAGQSLASGWLISPMWLLHLEVKCAQPGLHSWAGCDSALSRQGKIKALKIVQQNQTFREAVIALGTSWTMSHLLFRQIQGFTCQLYSKNTKIAVVNNIRYQMFCAKKGDIESELPRGRTVAAHTSCKLPSFRLVSQPRGLPAHSQSSSRAWLGIKWYHNWVAQKVFRIRSTFYTNVPSNFSVTEKCRLYGNVAV